jgi:hypothetical protein
MWKPAEQLVHVLSYVVDPEGPEPYIPAGHQAHVLISVAPTVALYDPSGQVVHVPELVAPSAVLYLPARQLVHVPLEVAFTALLYVPATQLVHELALDPLQVPAGHDGQPCVVTILA